MPLSFVPSAIDTETDGPSIWKYTAIVQECPEDATSLEDVNLYFTTRPRCTAWDAFFDEFEITEKFRDPESKGLRSVIERHCFNLGGFEWKGITECLCRRYGGNTEKVPQSAKNRDRIMWEAVADDKSVYRITIYNMHGVKLVFTDDLKRLGGNIEMKEAAEMVRAGHPEWFEGVPDVKETTDYHEGWLSPNDPDYGHSIHYAKVDAYSQAMILRNLRQEGWTKALTAPSLGFKEALSILKPHAENSYFAKLWFTKAYPPLNRTMQDIVEDSLIGGFVYGVRGVHYGTFTHLDYSSSYPYEYVYGEMFKGKVMITLPGEPYYERVLRSPKFVRWYYVSFDFRFKEGMLPAISGESCDLSFVDRACGMSRKKMTEGRVSRKLFTEQYLNELGSHYDILNLEVHELWFADRDPKNEIGKAVKEFYSRKKRLKDEGKSKTLPYKMIKLFLNGGIHGKTITKTHRQSRMWRDDGTTYYVWETNEPEYNALLGFTAMQNARARLLRDCRKMIEHGYHVYMCDTDSMVVDAPKSEVERILGKDKFCEGVDISTNLGRFEEETDADACKDVEKSTGQHIAPSAEFDTFKCWGLKKYCELRALLAEEVPDTPHPRIHHMDGRTYLFRKSAFAGMSGENQHDLLAEAPVDQDTPLVWTQLGKKTPRNAKAVVLTDVTKHAYPEDMWGAAPAPLQRNTDLTHSKEIFRKMIAQRY